MGNSTSKPNASKTSLGKSSNGIGIASHPYQKEVNSSYIHRQENDDGSLSASSYSSEDDYLEPKVMFQDSPPKEDKNPSAAVSSKSMPTREESQSSIVTVKTAVGSHSCNSNTLNHDMIHRSAEVFEPHTTRSSLSYSTNDSDASCAKTVEFNYDKTSTDRYALKNVTNSQQRGITATSTQVNVPEEEIEVVLRQKKKKKGRLFRAFKKKKKKSKGDNSNRGYESDGSVGIRSRTDFGGGPYGSSNYESDVDSDSDIQAASLDYYRQLHYRQQQLQKQQHQQLLQQNKSPTSWSEVRSLADDSFEDVHGLGAGSVPNPAAAVHISKPPESQYFNMSLQNVGKLPTILDVSYVSSTADTSVDQKNLDTSVSMDKSRMNLSHSNHLNNSSSMLGELTGHNLALEDDEEDDGEEAMESYLRFTLADNSKDDEDGAEDEDASKQDSSEEIDERNDLEEDNGNTNNLSMVSQEYTVGSGSCHDEEKETSPTNKLPFSCTKDADSLDYTKRMNAFLDKNHASYVEGETLADIETPTAKLGDLFENMNLTRHQSAFYEEGDSTGMDASGTRRNLLTREASLVDVDDDGASLTLFRTSISVGEQPGITSHDFQCQEGDDDNRSCQRRGSALHQTEAEDDDDLTSDVQETSALDRTSVLHDTMLDQTNGDVNASVLQEEVSVTALDRTDMAVELSTFRQISSNQDLNRTDMAIANENESLNETNMTMLDLLNEGEEIEGADDSPDELLKGCHEPPNASFDRVDKDDVINKEDSSSSQFDEIETIDEEDDSTLLSFQQTPHPNDGAICEDSPIPTWEQAKKAPTSAAEANLLPCISQEGDDEDILINNSNDQNDKLNPMESLQQHKQEQVKFTHSLNFGDQRNMRNPIPSRGPEIGTVIKLVSKARQQEEDVSYCDNASAITDLSSSCASSAIMSLQVQNRKKMAFSKQAATNSTFLFSDEPVRLCRQAQAASKIDQQRLSLINIEEASRRVSEMSSTTTSQVEDPMETIRRLAEQKKNRVVGENRNQSVFISKKEGEYLIHKGGMASKAVSTAIQENRSEVVDKETSVTVHETWMTVQPNVAPQLDPIVSEANNGTQELVSEPLKMYDVEDDSDSSVDHNETSTSKRNENDDTISSLAKFLSPTNKKRKVQVEDDSTSGISSYDSLAEVLDELSVTDLQKKYSAITPMKTKSPYVRFKKAIRVFEQNRPKTSSRHRKNDTPKKNASAKKESVIFHQPKSSSKKKRRKLLVDKEHSSSFSLLNNFESAGVVPSNPSQTVESSTDTVVEEEVTKEVEIGSTEIKLEVVSDTEESTVVEEEAANEVEDIPTEEEVVETKEEYNDSGEMDESDRDPCSSPYDEMDELNITPSSGSTKCSSRSCSDYSQSSLSMTSSPYSDSSEDDIFKDLRNETQSSYASSPDRTLSSPEQESNVLRSAMKKRGSATAHISNHHVKWNNNFDIHQDRIERDESQSSQVFVEDSPSILSPAPALASRAAAVNPRTQQNNKHISDEESIDSLSTAPPLSAILPPDNATNGQRAETQQQIGFSPTSESFMSLSPAPPISKKRSVVNPRAMNVTRDKENMDSNVYSPTGDSLCSYSPLQMSSKNHSSVTPSKMPAASNALCLSPLQRTPMQARRWRALEAQAEQRNKKSSTKKKRSAHKRTPLGKLKIKS